jgi:hypothetical protein
VRVTRPGDTREGIHEEETPSREISKVTPRSNIMGAVEVEINAIRDSVKCHLIVVFAPRHRNVILVYSWVIYKT